MSSAFVHFGSQHRQHLLLDVGQPRYRHHQSVHRHAQDLWRFPEPPIQIGAYPGEPLRDAHGAATHWWVADPLYTDLGKILIGHEAGPEFAGADGPGLGAGFGGDCARPLPPSPASSVLPPHAGEERSCGDFNPASPPPRVCVGEGDREAVGGVAARLLVAKRASSRRYARSASAVRVFRGVRGSCVNARAGRPGP